MIPVLNMPTYKQSVNARQMIGIRWRVRQHCLMPNVRLSCSCLGIFSICWCFDCNMRAICCSNALGKAIFLFLRFA